MGVTIAIFISVGTIPDVEYQMNEMFALFQCPYQHENVCDQSKISTTFNSAFYDWMSVTQNFVRYNNHLLNSSTLLINIIVLALLVHSLVLHCCINKKAHTYMYVFFLPSLYISKTIMFSGLGSFELYYLPIYFVNKLPVVW